jgi:hypothetical protein
MQLESDHSDPGGKTRIGPQIQETGTSLGGDADGGGGRP